MSRLFFKVVWAVGRTLILSLLLGLAASGTTTWSCTTFVLKDGNQTYFGRNLDWSWENGLIMVNQRNVEKTSLVPPGAKGAHWTSKYGSVTFNQFGQEMPYGGINEAGLVVECMWLSETEYAPVDSRPSINLLQWIQYLLDNCHTIDDVLATEAQVRVYAPSGSAKIHYLVSDAEGDSAVIEILHGKVISHRNANLPFSVLANNTYESAVSCARTDPSGANEEKGSSLWRFSTAVARTENFKAASTEKNLEYAFDTLAQVSQGNFTVWSVVYDISHRRIYYRSGKNPKLRSVNLESLNFSCGRPVQYRDIEVDSTSQGEGEWQNLSESSHRKYLEEFVSDAALVQKLGDLAPQIRGQLSIIRNFRCSDSDTAR